MVPRCPLGRAIPSLLAAIKAGRRPGQSCVECIDRTHRTDRTSPSTKLREDVKAQPQLGGLACRRVGGLGGKPGLGVGADRHLPGGRVGVGPTGEIGLHLDEETLSVLLALERPVSLPPGVVAPSDVPPLALAVPRRGYPARLAVGFLDRAVPPVVDVSHDHELLREWSTEATEPTEPQWGWGCVGCGGCVGGGRGLT